MEGFQSRPSSNGSMMYVTFLAHGLYILANPTIIALPMAQHWIRAVGMKFSLGDMSYVHRRRVRRSINLPGI